MDTYLLNAAVLFALSATSQTTSAVDEFLQNAPFANADLDPLTYELFDLRTPLERLGDPEDVVIPVRLQPPLLAIVRACGDALARIDAVLTECEDGPLQTIAWATKAAPEIQTLKSGLQVCRRALQLALEVANLAAAKELGAEYLDQDTSRILALVRRLLVQVQPKGQEADSPLNAVSRKSLDQILLYVQSLSRDNEGSKNGSALHIETSSSVQSNEDSHTLDTPDVPEPETPSHSPPMPMAKKLTNAVARWSLSSPRNSNSIASTISSESRPNSALLSPRSPGPEDDISPASPANGVRHTSRQASHTSHASQLSFSSTSSRGSRMFSATSVPFGLYPPMPPPRNPRRTTQDSMEGQASLGLPSPTSPHDSKFSGTNSIFGHVSASGSFTSSDRRPSDVPTQLPLFAVSPSDKIVINSSDMPQIHHRRPTPSSIELVQTRLLTHGKEKGQGNAASVFYVHASPASYILASKHGDRTIKIQGLPQANIQASLKFTFYVQMQPRSRDFFVSSHAILSETRNLIAVATGFGHTLEIWNWTRKKKLQTIESAYRWASARADVYETLFHPLACYREDGHAIDLYPVIKDGPVSSKASSKKPLGKPTTIELREVGLPHVPMYPELAYSATAPLLVAAAGPRPPRPGHPPPEHSAMLMAWELESNPAKQSSRPCRVSIPAQHKELETALPCGLATYGSVVVSIWIPNNVRVIGRPGSWRVEPVAVHERWVLVWDFAVGTTTTFPIPDRGHGATLSCISPDCRFVAYREGPVISSTASVASGGKGEKGGYSLVILDALKGGKELWRTPSAPGSTEYAKVYEQLMDVSKVREISFSADGGLFFVGDVDGAVGVYEVRAGRNGSVDVTPK